jgi:hypothetical protein
VILHNQFHSLTITIGPEPIIKTDFMELSLAFVVCCVVVFLKRLKLLQSVLLTLNLVSFYRL